jgi:hypothetical protein
MEAKIGARENPETVGSTMVQCFLSITESNILYGVVCLDLNQACQTKIIKSMNGLVAIWEISTQFSD